MTDTQNDTPRWVYEDGVADEDLAPPGLYPGFDPHDEDGTCMGDAEEDVEGVSYVRLPFYPEQALASIPDPREVAPNDMGMGGTDG